MCQLTCRRIFGKNLFQDQVDSHGGFFIAFANSSSEQLNVFVQVPPEKLWQCLNWYMRLYKLDNAADILVIVTTCPEEGRVHQSSQDTDSRRRESSFGSRYVSTTICITKVMASLCSIMAIKIIVAVLYTKNGMSFGKRCSYSAL